MSDVPTPSKGPEKEKSLIPNMLWLTCAFVPSATIIACLKIKNPSQSLFSYELLLDLVCSFAAAFGLLRNVKDTVHRAFLTVGVAVLIFMMNIAIAIFIGCSGMGR